MSVQASNGTRAHKIQPIQSVAKLSANQRQMQKHLTRIGWEGGSGGGWWIYMS